MSLIIAFFLRLDSVFFSFLHTRSIITRPSDKDALQCSCRAKPLSNHFLVSDVHLSVRSATAGGRKSFFHLPIFFSLRAHQRGKMKIKRKRSGPWRACSVHLICLLANSHISRLSSCAVHALASLTSTGISHQKSNARTRASFSLSLFPFSRRLLARRGKKKSAALTSVNTFFLLYMNYF